jgi:uncharacterized protein YoxC
MATQQDLDNAIATLTNSVSAITSDATALAANVQTLQSDLNAYIASKAGLEPPVDLANEVNSVQTQQAAIDQVHATLQQVYTAVLAMDSALHS